MLLHADRRIELLQREHRGPPGPFQPEPDRRALFAHINIYPGDAACDGGADLVRERASTVPIPNNAGEIERASTAAVVTATGANGPERNTTYRTQRQSQPNAYEHQRATL